MIINAINVIQKKKCLYINVACLYEVLRDKVKVMLLAK